MKSKPFRITSACVALLPLLPFGGCVSPSFKPYSHLVLEPAEAARPGLQAQFFGVSTLLVGDGEDAIMIDGFFSRPGWWTLLFGSTVSDPKRINDALDRGQVDKITALLVAHSHHDHAMDSAAVAEARGALLYGSHSTINIAVGQGFDAGRTRLATASGFAEHGKFRIRFFDSPHSDPELFPGTIKRPLRQSPKVWDYKGGENHSFLLCHPSGSLLIVPSANFYPGQFKGVKADVVFLSVAMLGRQSEDSVRDYWRETVVATGAKLVVPIHWDDFTRPLDDQPLKVMPRPLDNIPKTLAILFKTAGEDGVRIGFMPLYEKIDVSAPGPGRVSCEFAGPCPASR